MQRTAVFAGSFDPFTNGHKAIVERALPLFDKIIVAIGHNADKRSLYSLEQRLEWIAAVFANEPRVHAEWYEGLTVDFCKKHEARFLLRGVRNTIDFEYEKAIAQMNKQIGNGIETIILCTDAEHSAVSATAIRDIIRYGGDVSSFLPKEIVIK